MAMSSEDKKSKLDINNDSLDEHMSDDKKMTAEQNEIIVECSDGKEIRVDLNFFPSATLRALTKSDFADSKKIRILYDSGTFLREYNKYLPEICDYLQLYKIEILKSEDEQSHITYGMKIIGGKFIYTGGDLVELSYCLKLACNNIHIDNLRILIQVTCDKETICKNSEIIIYTSINCNEPIPHKEGYGDYLDELMEISSDEPWILELSPLFKYDTRHAQRIEVGRTIVKTIINSVELINQLKKYHKI